MQALAEKLVLERLLNSWVLTYISPKQFIFFKVLGLTYLRSRWRTVVQARHKVGKG